MLCVNDFKLVSLSAIVHDEAQFRDYRLFINDVQRGYDADTARMLSDTFDRAVTFEERVLEKEVGFWRKYGDFKQPETFVTWMDSPHGYGSRYESDTRETYFYSADMLMDCKTGTFVGRSNLFAGIDKGIWTGMGGDCIHPDYRGRGLGRMIMAHRLDQARRLGIEHMKLNVGEGNIPSMRRFERLESAGLLSNYKFVRGRVIAWIEPKLTLDQAYHVLGGAAGDEQDYAPASAL